MEEAILGIYADLVLHSRVFVPFFQQALRLFNPT